MPIERKEDFLMRKVPTSLSIKCWMKSSTQLELIPWNLVSLVQLAGRETVETCEKLKRFPPFLYFIVVKKRVFLKLFQKFKTKCSWRINIPFHLSVGLKHKAVRMGRYRRIRKYRYCKNYQWRYLTSSWACVISGHHLKAKSTVVCGFSNVSCVFASGVLRDNEHW